MQQRSKSWRRSSLYLPNKFTKNNCYPLDLKKPRMVKRKILRCDDCDLDFDIYSTFYSHMRIHHREPLVRCFHCEEKFLTVSARNKHFYNQKFSEELDQRALLRELSEPVIQPVHQPEIIQPILQPLKPIEPQPVLQPLKPSEPRGLSRSSAWNPVHDSPLEGVVAVKSALSSYLAFQ